MRSQRRGIIRVGRVSVEKPCWCHDDYEVFEAETEQKMSKNSLDTGCLVLERLNCLSQIRDLPDGGATRRLRCYIFVYLEKI
jgi:hypothetical protein